MNNIELEFNKKKCFNQIKSSKIPVYFMLTGTADSVSENKMIYISNNTGGIFTNISNDKILETTKRYLKDISLREGLSNENIYLLTFNTSQKGLKNFFKITYKNQNKISLFKNESVSRESLLFYREFSIGIIILLIIFISLFLYNQRKKKKYQNIINKSFNIKNINDNKDYDYVKPAVLILKTKDITKTINIPVTGCIIGRNPDCDINISEPTASGIHAEIKLKKGKYLITDLDSTNGTFVNGSRVDKLELKSNDLIKIGTALLKIKC